MAATATPRTPAGRVADTVPFATTVRDSWTTVQRYRKVHGRWPSVARPRTFNEKLIRKRLTDHRPYLVLTADKYAVRDYVAAKVGREHLAELHQVVDTADALDFDRLPRSFVVKPTHGSGAVALVRDKDSHDLDELRAIADAWLRRRWALWYRKIPPRLVVEEFLRGPDGEPPNDFKFFVMNGRVEIVQVDTERFTGHCRNLYSTDWQLLPGRFVKHPPGAPSPEPANLAAMCELATRLGADTDFVRVDLYDLGDRVVFGELTHTPSAGRGPLEPLSFDEWLGSAWDQPRRYR